MSGSEQVGPICPLHMKNGINRRSSPSNSHHRGRAVIPLCSRSVSCSQIGVIKRKKNPVMKGYIKMCIFRQIQFWYLPSSLSHTNFFLLEAYLRLLVPVLLLLCSRSQPSTSEFPPKFAFPFLFFFSTCSPHTVSASLPDLLPLFFRALQNQIKNLYCKARFLREDQYNLIVKSCILSNDTQKLLCYF